MRDATALCSELQTIQNVIALAGNPPSRSEAQTALQCADTARSILQRVESAERDAGVSKLPPRLHDEAVSLLVSIKRHVCGIVRYATAGASPKVEVFDGMPANLALIEQFSELCDKCCYPLMDMVERITKILGATPMPADAITPELATKLFCVTRNGLSQAMKGGQLQSYRDLQEPKTAPRRCSEAQLAKLYERRALAGAGGRSYAVPAARWL